MISGLISKSTKIILAILVIFLISEAFGFCLKRFQFVNDKHLLELAFQAWIPNKPSGNKYISAFNSENKYSSLDELISKNINCCTIKKTGYDINGNYISVLFPFRRFYRVEIRFEGEQLFSYFNCCEELIIRRSYSSGKKDSYDEFE